MWLVLSHRQSVSKVVSMTSMSKTNKHKYTGKQTHNHWSKWPMWGGSKRCIDLIPLDYSPAAAAPAIIILAITTTWQMLAFVQPCLSLSPSSVQVIQVTRSWSWELRKRRLTCCCSSSATHTHQVQKKKTNKQTNNDSVVASGLGG